MPSTEFSIASITTQLSRLKFPKLGVSGICVRFPGLLTKRNFEAIMESLQPYELTEAVIQEKLAVNQFHFMDDSPLTVVTFCFVKESKKDPDSKLALLADETRNKAWNLMSGFIHEKVTDDSSQEVGTDQCFLAMVCHRNWKPEEEIFNHLGHWMNTKNSTMDEVEIPGSGGYRFITATFKR